MFKFHHYRVLFSFRLLRNHITCLESFEIRFVTSVKISVMFHRRLITINSNYWRNNPLITKTAGLTSTCPLSEVNHHPAVRSDLSARRSPNRCWLSRLELSVEISSYPNFSWYWIASNLINWPKVPSNQVPNQCRLGIFNFKTNAVNLSMYAVCVSLEWD